VRHLKRQERTRKWCFEKEILQRPSPHGAGTEE
jgi:hypothetical protein